MLFFNKIVFISFVIIFVSEDIYCSSGYKERDGSGCNIMKKDLDTIKRDVSELNTKLDGLILLIQDRLLQNIENTLTTVTKISKSAFLKNGESLIANISHQVNTDIMQKAILPKINEQLALLKNVTFEERNIIRLLENVTISRNNSSQEGCQPNAVVNTNTTTILTRNPSNETHPDPDPSTSRLLQVTVPSSVQVRPDAWKEYKIPEEDDLDEYMKNTTGCEYMAKKTYHGGLKSASNSTARGGTWRRRLAVRGAGLAGIYVTWGSRYYYHFLIGHKSNTQTKVFDHFRDKLLLQRATPGVMSKERYTQFYYIQLENGVMSFGVLGDSTPWLRRDVVVSAGDVIQMKYDSFSPYGVKLHVCA